MGGIGYVDDFPDLMPSLQQQVSRVRESNWGRRRVFRLCGPSRHTCSKWPDWFTEDDEELAETLELSASGLKVSKDEMEQMVLLNLKNGRSAVYQRMIEAGTHSGNDSGRESKADLGSCA